MLKFVLSAASIAVVLATSSVQAQQKTLCTEESIAKLTADAMQVKDSQRKEMATKEMNTAKEMMAQKKMDECVTHMENAMKAMTRARGD